MRKTQKQTQTRARGYKTQLSIEFQMLIATKMLKNEDISGFNYFVFIMLINVKMPTIVGILTFLSMIT